MGRCGFGIWEHAAREGKGKGKGSESMGVVFYKEQGTRHLKVRGS